MAFPDRARYVIIGAGIHGLSTAWHLAAGLEAAGKGTGSDVLVIDEVGQDGQTAKFSGIQIKGITVNCILVVSNIYSSC